MIGRPDSFRAARILDDHDRPLQRKSISCATTGTLRFTKGGASTTPGRSSTTPAELPAIHEPEQLPTIRFTELTALRRGISRRQEEEWPASLLNGEVLATRGRDRQYWFRRIGLCMAGESELLSPAINTATSTRPSPDVDVSTQRPIREESLAKSSAIPGVLAPRRWDRNSHVSHQVPSW